MKTFVLVLMAFAVGVSAQEPAQKTVNAGILNPRVITMPKPDYPEQARSARIGGLVAVDVIVDESGLVISATAELYDQHDTRNGGVTAEGERVKVDATLCEAAEAAARQATFKPLPFKVSGKLIYNFVADNSTLPARIGEIYGPLLNAKAIEMPQPVYPAEARAANVSGTVTVHVTIDETGTVTSATATSGPIALRASAEEAALKARFKPDLLAGQPTIIRGVLSYDFSLASKPVQ
jgi:TonB family protein